MKRKNWISLVCGGLLLIALATPAAAADGGAPSFTLLERVLSWVESWVPTAPAFDRRTAADSEDDLADGTLGTTSSYCEDCNNNGELTGYADPDG